MDKGIHFISGLPRSGSTLLAAILRQNPMFHADMSSAVGPLFQRLLWGMGAQTEAAALLRPGQRPEILKGLFDSYYKSVHPEKIVFDTSRLWCSKMEALAELFPAARVIVCVRELAWIMDSFERITRKNPFLLSRMVKPQNAGNRAEFCATP